MEKTIKINLAGTIFQIEEQAYEVLRIYLQEINHRLNATSDSSEIIEDIEARIAEIFLSSPSWKTGVISEEDVREMMSTMGSADEIAGDIDDGEYTYQRKQSSRRLYRDSDGAIIGGVCNGLGAYLRIDPVWIRIIFIIFSLVYLSGVFVYIVLWIALPRAITPLQKRDLYGNGDRNRNISGNIRKEVNDAARNVKATADDNVSRVGNAFNEMFKAFGKFFIILFRIVLVIIGISLIISAFAALFSFLFISFFPNSVFIADFIEPDIFYLPDLLTFIVNPAFKTWLIILTSLVIILPLLGIIYWGIRMVFQFRVRDLYLNLAMFLVWVLSCTALSLILFSEGISFTNTGRAVERISIDEGNILYLYKSNMPRVDYNRAVGLPFDDKYLYIDDDRDKLYSTPQIFIYHTDDDPRIEVTKYSKGRTSGDAREKAGNLDYNFNFVDDTLHFDEFFNIPRGNMWSGANIKIRIYMPEGYRIYIDEEAEDMFDDYIGNGIYSYELGNNEWEMTKDGLQEFK